MSRKLGCSLCLLTLILGISSLSASADQIYSNLGPAGNVYDVTNGRLLAVEQ
jgi:hypothetical protein